MDLVTLGAGGYGGAQDDTYSGPDYPRIIDNGDGTRRIEWWPGQVSTAVETRDHPTQQGGDRPRFYPGVVPGAKWWYPSAGQARRFPATRELTPTDVLMLPRRLRPDVLSFAGSYIGGATEDEAHESLGPDRTLPCFSEEFRFAYLPSNIPGQLFQRVQAPTHGWPDQVPTYPDGSANPYRTYAGRGGYATGTQAHPYRPWLDPTNPLYGHCVGHVADRAMPPAPPGPREPPPAPVEPQLPETHDPWEDVPPVVDGPWQPDPDDPEGPMIPTGPTEPGGPSEPVGDPTAPGTPCWDARSGVIGVLDDLGQCVEVEPPTTGPPPTGPPQTGPQPAAGRPRLLMIGAGLVALLLLTGRR